MAPPVPPPPELLRFKVPLLMVSASYIAVLLLGVVAGTFQNPLYDMAVAVAALLMALRADRCLGQCVMPFLLFAGMAVIFDALGVLTTLARGYPGPESFFASSCPRNSTITLLKNTTVFLQRDGKPAEDRAYTLPNNTTAFRKDDFCDWQWVLANAVALLSVLMDVVSTALAWRIFKAAGGASGLMGPGLAGNDPAAGFGALGGGPPGAPGGGGGGGPGGFQPGGLRPGGGQEMQSSRQPGFTPFSGAGQSLNS